MPTLPNLPRDEDGKLPKFAWPGGYPMCYLTADDGILCPDCANGENGSLSASPLDPECPDDDQWRVVAGDIHYEGDPLICDHCGANIESAYGPVEGEEG